MSDPPHARRRAVAATSRKPPTELKSVRVIFEEDPDPDTSYLEELDDHRAAYERGEFKLLGVYVEADVVIAEIPQTLTSSGLWGIESETDEEELDHLIDGEWQALRVVLKTVGVPTEKLPLVVERAWIEWRT